MALFTAICIARGTTLLERHIANGSTRCVAERVMKYINKYLLALPVVVAVAAFASQASAQNTAGRDAAIGRCIRVAHLQYPHEEQQIQRADGYKGFMVCG